MGEKSIPEDELIPEVEPTEAELDFVRRRLDVQDKRKAELEKSPYDGVLGIPPNWVSVPIIDRFRRNRGRVLNDWRYTPEQVCKWMDRYCRIGEEDDDWFYPGCYPNDRELDCEQFRETIGFLAHVRWAVSLGPNRGLKELSGKDTRLGYQRRNQLTEFGKRRGADKHEERAKEWARWGKERDRMLESGPRLTNKSEIARRIKKNLNLTETIQTIRKHI